MHGWGNLDEDAKRIENAETARLAVCNIDWDRITANDLFGKFYFGIIRKFKMPIHKTFVVSNEKLMILTFALTFNWRYGEAERVIPV